MYIWAGGEKTPAAVHYRGFTKGGLAKIITIIIIITMIIILLI